MGQVIPFKAEATEYLEKTNVFTNQGTTATVAYFDEEQNWMPPFPVNEGIQKTLRRLDKEIKEVKDLLAKVLDRIETKGEDEEMITLRDIPLEQAKDEIALYFKKNDGKEIGYDELVTKLTIDPKTVILACEELEREGKIG